MGQSVKGSVEWCISSMISSNFCSSVFLTITIIRLKNEIVDQFPYEILNDEIQLQLQVVMNSNALRFQGAIVIFMMYFCYHEEYNLLVEYNHDV